ALLLIELVVEVAYHVVERTGIVRAATDFQVEQRAEDRAFVVVRDGRVDRVFVRAVILDPRIDARLFHAHRAPPRHLLQSLYGARQPFEIFFVGYQPGAPQQDVLVVARDAFGDPEQARVVLLRVVEGAEGVGAYAFDVPRVEELVRGRREEVAR